MCIDNSAILCGIPPCWHTEPKKLTLPKQGKARSHSLCLLVTACMGIYRVGWRVGGGRAVPRQTFPGAKQHVPGQESLTHFWLYFSFCLFPDPTLLELPVTFFFLDQRYANTTLSHGCCIKFHLFLEVLSFTWLPARPLAHMSNHFHSEILRLCWGQYNN